MCTRLLLCLHCYRCATHFRSVRFSVYYSGCLVHTLKDFAFYMSNGDRCIKTFDAFVSCAWNRFFFSFFSKLAVAVPIAVTVDVAVVVAVSNTDMLIAFLWNRSQCKESRSKNVFIHHVKMHPTNKNTTLICLEHQNEQPQPLKANAYYLNKITRANDLMLLVFGYLNLMSW